MNATPDVTNIAYLISAVCFILGLKFLGSAQTARRGNALAMLGMSIAIVVTLFDKDILSFPIIVAGLVVGSFIGAVAARTIPMTNMPQMVALFNGFGGIASALVAYSAFLDPPSTFGVGVTGAIALSVLIGTLTFTGSFVAFLKLQGILKGAPIVFPLQQALNGLLILAAVACGVLAAVSPEYQYALLAVAILAAFLGALTTFPIGGADMPVVVSLLNSYSGLAAAATGFALSNNVLIISGALVGASGLILTRIMCVSMNRSLGNVLFGAVGGGGGVESAAVAERGPVTRYTPEDVAIVMDGIQSAIIIPGYGLAVAQAQHVLHEMAQILIDNGVEVRYAIHPVAGRMPGHMNVLLAEANVSYDLLYEMEAINNDFADTDLALVIGANDVINPAARTKKESPLYGMPILNADQARTVVICKRSLGAGFAGEDNELFFDPKTMMVFGDAKKTVTDLVRTLKDRKG